MIFFSEECLLKFENFFSVNSKKFSIGRMINPTSFLISNRGWRKPEDEIHSEFRSAVNRITKVLPRFNYVEYPKGAPRLGFCNDNNYIVMRRTNYFYF